MDLTRAYFPRAGSGFRWSAISPGEAVAAGERQYGEPTVPERFQTFPVSDVSPGAAAARGFTQSALDAAALPVTAAGFLAESLGYPNAAANLSGQEAAEAAEWIINRKEPRAIRREQNAARTGELAPALKAGELAGDVAGGAALGALTGRIPGTGAVLNMTKKARHDRGQEVARAAKQHPDGEVLRDYMSSGYDKLNRELRTGAVSEGTAMKADRLNNLLRDMEDKGHTDQGLVYRGVELPQGVLDQWRRAQAVENRSFWSTSRDASTAESFATMTPSGGHEKAILRLTQKKGGVPVGGFEGEVLQRPGKTWVLKRETKNRYGVPILDLHEVDAAPPGIVPAISFNGPERGKAAGMVLPSGEERRAAAAGSASAVYPFPKPGDLTIGRMPMRPESLAYLRKGGKPVDSLPVTVAYRAGETKPYVIDGRHRITVARERGENTVKGDVVYYGPRMGERKRLRNVEIPIGAAAEGES